VNELLSGGELRASLPDMLYHRPPIRYDPQGEAQFEISVRPVPGHVIRRRLAFLPKPLRDVARAGYRAIRGYRK
jgi:hypothetical protein